MPVTYVNGDISTSDNVSTVTGVSWTGLGHVAGDYAFSIWALVSTATGVVQDSDLTTIEDHIDQNLRAIYSRRLMTGAETGTVSYVVDAGSLNRMAVALAIYRGVGSLGTAVRFTEGGTAVEKHPAANNLSYTPTADNALLLLIYSERSSTGNTAGTLTPPTHVGTGIPATIRRERGTGSSGGVYVCIAEFQLGAGTAGVAQTFTQWDATPDTLIASNADMWIQALYPAATGVPLNLGRAVETDTALPITASKSLTIGPATETGIARSASLSKSLTLIGASESDTARALTATKAAIWGRSTETDTARAVTHTKTLHLGVATEASTAPPLVFVKPLPLGTTSEVNQARALTLAPVVPREDLTVVVGPTRVGTLSVGATRQSLTAGDTRTNAASVAATRSATSIGPTRRDRGA